MPIRTAGLSTVATGRETRRARFPFQFDREMGNLLLEVAAKWSKPFSTWTYDDVSRAAPEVPALAVPWCAERRSDSISSANDHPMH